MEDFLPFPCQSLLFLGWPEQGSMVTWTLDSCPVTSFLPQLEIKISTETAAGHGNVLDYFCHGVWSSLAFSVVFGCLFSLTPTSHGLIILLLDSPPQEFS